MFLLPVLGCVWIPDTEHQALLASLALDDTAPPAPDDTSADTAEGSGCAASTWFPDADGDGHGDAGSPVESCDEPANHVATGDDCDDADAASAPGLTEVCGDGADNDCDGGSNGCHLEGVIDVGSSDAPRFMSGGLYPFWEGDVAWVGDTDGDGADEFVLSSPMADSGVGAVYLIPGLLEGSWEAPSAAAATLAPETADATFGTDVAAVGDVDGDGLPDFAVSHAATSTVYTFAAVVRGATRADDALGTRTGEAEEEVGADLLGGADVVGGAETDVVVASRARCASSGLPGRAWLLPGPLDTGADFSDAISVTGEADGDGFGCSVAIVDANADGTGDVLWGAGGASSAFLFLGPVAGSNLSSGEADIRILGSEQFGSEVSEHGDADDDGYGNFIVTARTDDTEAQAAGAAMLLDGDDLALGANASTVAYASVHATLQGTYCCTPGSGDLDGDGTPDLVLGVPYWDAAGYNDNGAVFVFHGALTGAYVLPAADFVAENTTDHRGTFGVLVSASGDGNGDGTGDVLAMARFEPPLGILYLVRGAGW